MSSLKARRAAVRATMRPISDQLALMRHALVRAATQPDSPENNAALRALCGATVFVIDAAVR